MCLTTECGSRIAADAADAEAECFNRVPRMKYRKRVEMEAQVVGVRDSVYTVQATQVVRKW